MIKLAVPFIDVRGFFILKKIFIVRFFNIILAKKKINAINRELSNMENSIQNHYQGFDENINLVACNLANMANLEFLETVYFSKEKEGVE